ncbi:MAG TPA: flagellar hook-associated protein FlgK, partial [Rubrivivax sp.]|nr:flagellar hook-associated protein FlgK [Rubrivivax sp.]
MGASPLMALGIRAMAANYAALQTTGHNIANASVKGYSRQQVELATSQGQFTGAGFFGRGVDVVSVTRSHNEFLTRESDSAGSLSAMDAARLTQLRRLENIFKPGEAGLGHAANQLFASMVDLTSNPADLATRQVVLARAGDMAARFSDAGAALDETQFAVTSELNGSVASINSLAKSVAVTNQRIAALRGLGQPANDLLDERERLVAQISEHVKVTRIDAEDGSLALFIGGGQRLVLGAAAAEMRVMQDGVDPSRSAVAMVEGNELRALDGPSLGGGRLAGLLRFQNEDLAEGRNLVGRLALAIGGALNTQQLRGLGLQAPLGQVASSALFEMGPSRGLPDSRNARDAAGTLIGSVALTVTDPSALRASDYTLRESLSTPGSWELKRLSDGTTSTVNSGDVVDGMRIDISNAQPGDRFLLQPVTRGANGMRALLDDPRDVAAAS